MNESKSFLFAREPSVIAYNRTNLPKLKIFNSTTEIDENVATRNDETVATGNDENEMEKEDDKFLHVFLRIKGDSGGYEDIYEVNKNSLICSKSDDHIKKNYTFSKIFGPEVNQTEIFNFVVKSKLLAFINGKNSSLFAYGASGSGKTFTIVGTPEEPGLIPRSLEYIFRSISVIRKIPETKPLPDGFTKEIDDQMLSALDAKKAFIISAIHTDQAAHKKTYRQMQARLSSEPIAEVEYKLNVSASIWVTFAEIYNETVYDLLVPSVPKGHPRPKLELGKSRDDNTYIKNLTTLNVSDGLEAYQILQYGLQNLNYAATAINSHSSRSHCIFTIKLVQSSKQSNDVFISNFNFCDLAGSERLKKTLNFGDRLKESNKINTSLLVLGRCMENIRKYQQIKDKRMIPFRESKLTQIFQKALMGFERVEMIVNINPSKSMVDETIHVLNFSAVAKEIIVEEQISKPIRKRSRFSVMLEEERAKRANKFLKVTDGEIRILREANRCLKEERHNVNKSYDSLREAYDQLLEERDMLIERYEEEIESEKDRVIELYTDLLDKRQKMHEQQIKKLRQEYEQKGADVICISSSESDSDEEHEDFKEERRRFKTWSREELIQRVLELEEIVEEAKEECINEKSEVERYRELYKRAIADKENCENVVFKSRFETTGRCSLNI